MSNDPVSQPTRKQRSRRPELRFEKHYGEPMTEQEFDELCHLIAEMIFDKMKIDMARGSDKDVRGENPLGKGIHRDMNSLKAQP